MRVLYVDEAGCLGALPAATSDIQPVFAITALMFDAARLFTLTNEFVALKRRFFPHLCSGPQYLDSITCEIKGGSLRRSIALGNRDERRAAKGFLDRTLDLIARHDGRCFGRVWVKGIGAPFNGRSIYTSSMQDIYRTFQELLQTANDQGIVIADSRNKPVNTNVSHSVFTMKFQRGGDTFPNILEMPLFGHSDNHAGIQITDLLCSALLFPIAIQTYCAGHVTNVHTRDYTALKQRYGDRLRTLLFRYQDAQGKWRGGFTVSDRIGHRTSIELYR